jgi:hypothetical protein
MPPQLRLKTFAAFAALGLCCGKSLDLPPYEPVVTFRGIFNNWETYLPGHLLKPNTVELFNDTLRMYFYSEDYNDEKLPWTGDQLKVEIYGHFGDSIIDNHFLLMRFSRFTDENETYQIGPSDTLDKLLYAFFTLESMPDSGGNTGIEIKNISALMRRLVMGGGGGSGIEIKEGVIRWAVQPD